MKEATYNFDQAAGVVICMNARVKLSLFRMQMRGEHMPQQEKQGNKNRGASDEIHRVKGILFNRILKQGWRTNPRFFSSPPFRNRLQASQGDLHLPEKPHTAVPCFTPCGEKREIEPPQSARVFWHRCRYPHSEPFGALENASLLKQRFRSVFENIQFEVSAIGIFSRCLMLGRFLRPQPAPRYIRCERLLYRSGRQLHRAAP